MCSGLHGESESLLIMPSSTSDSDPTWLYNRDLLCLDHVPAPFTSNMKTAKQQRAAIKKGGIRTIQPHHCFTGLSFSSSSRSVCLASLAAPVPATAVSMTTTAAGAWGLAPAPLKPTAASVGNGGTKPFVGCGDVGCSSPASRPTARAPVEAPTTLPTIPLSVCDRLGRLPSPTLKRGGCDGGATRSPCWRKRSSDRLFLVYQSRCSWY